MRISRRLRIYVVAMLLFPLAFVVDAGAEESETFTDSGGNALPNVVLYRDSLSTDNTADSASEPVVHVMDQVDKQFSPQLLVISPGDLVAFPNSDDIRHHVYSFSEPRPFELRLYSVGESTNIDFPRPGIVVVGCNIHDQMIGHILVIETPEFRVSDDSGSVELPEDATHWMVWHPWMVEAEQQPIALSELLDRQIGDSISLDIKAPEQEAESELESRFNRAFNRGN